MRVLCLADLHLDFWEDEKRDPLLGCESLLRDLDVLVLAGDVSNKPKRRWTRFLTRLRGMTEAKLIVTPGNHDYYNYRIDAEHRLEEFAAAAGVEFAQKRSFHFGDVHLHCATLWSDFELDGDRKRAEQAARDKMNDYRLIRVEAGGFRKLKPFDTLALHLDHRSWIDASLAEARPGERHIVVTHHAPVREALVRTHGEWLDPVYASDLSALVERRRPHAWLFGHTHQAFEEQRGATLLRNCSIGYPMEDKGAARARVESLVLDL